MKTVLVLLALFVLVGCSNPAYVRVVEYDGGGAVGVFTGAVGGCAVHQGGGDGAFATVVLVYDGKACGAEIKIDPTRGFEQPDGK